MFFYFHNRVGIITGLTYAPGRTGIGDMFFIPAAAKIQDQVFKEKKWIHASIKRVKLNLVRIHHKIVSFTWSITHD